MHYSLNAQNVRTRQLIRKFWDSLLKRSAGHRRALLMFHTLPNND
jgi:hypothetical protein